MLYSESSNKIMKSYLGNRCYLYLMSYNDCGTCLDPMQSDRTASLFIDITIVFTGTLLVPCNSKCSFLSSERLFWFTKNTIATI